MLPARLHGLCGARKALMATVNCAYGGEGFKQDNWMKDQSKTNVNHLFRCIERCYAEEMVNYDCLFFNYPINWIRQAEKDGKEG